MSKKSSRSTRATHVPLFKFDEVQIREQQLQLRHEQDEIQQEITKYDLQLFDLENKYIQERRALEAERQSFRDHLKDSKQREQDLRRWDGSELEQVLSRFERKEIEKFPRTSEYGRTIRSSFTDVYADIVHLPKHVQTRYLEQLGHLFPCVTEKRYPRSCVLESGKTVKGTIAKPTRSVLLTGHPEFTQAELDILSKFRVRIVYVTYDYCSKHGYTYDYDIKIKDA